MYCITIQSRLTWRSNREPLGGKNQRYHGVFPCCIHCCWSDMDICNCESILSDFANLSDLTVDMVLKKKYLHYLTIDVVDII